MKERKERIIRRRSSEKNSHDRDGVCLVISLAEADKEGALLCGVVRRKI